MYDWIRENLFNKNGNIKWNYASIIKNTGAIDFILEKTSFLDFDLKLLERIYCIYNDIKYKKVCKICKSNVRFINFSSGYSNYCSNKCINSDNDVKIKISNSIKKNNIRKYGVENVYQNEKIKNKIKHNNLIKYGVDNVFKSSVIKEKIKNVIIKKYGVDHISKSDYFKDKLKNISQNKYGTNYFLQADEIKEKIKQTNLKRYNVNYILELKDKKEQGMLNKFGVKNISQLHISKNSLECLLNKNWMIEKYKHSSVNEIALELNVDKRTVINYLSKYNIIKYRSYKSLAEKEIIDFIGKNIKITINSRKIISPYELDIYIPDYNLAIEFNGLYYHSRYDKDYHLNKTKLCFNKGIKLLHIFENEWINKTNVWKSIINYYLNRNTFIDFKNCTTNNVNDIESFVFNNSLKECINGYNLGLFYNNDLIALMICNNKELRLYIKNYFNINFNDFFNYFINYYNIKCLNMILDRRYEYYKYNGFKLKKYTKCNCYYYKLPDITLFNNKINGYERIYDCGNIIYEWKK
jgi:very-short-patch-repair endonuclease